MNPTEPPSPQPSASDFGKWMALIAALLGWLFDGLEMGLFPLVQRPALDELVGPEARQQWQGIITSFFLIGAATGGVLFGWLGDRLGRVRAMMLSVLTYALVSALCGFASTAWEVGLYRFLAALGMGGEWSLGVALITEIWPNRSRAFLAGLIGAAANVGYLIIALVGLGVLQNIGETRSLLVAIGMSDAWADHLLRNQGWRFLMVLGAVPALLTFFIRAFVPESQRWLHEQEKGSTAHWQSQDLIGVLIGSMAACGLVVLWAVDLTGVPLIGDVPLALFAFKAVLSLLAIAVTTVGYTYPAACYLKRASGRNALDANGRETLKRMLLAACLSGVALLGTWGTIQQAPAWAGGLVEHIPLAERPPAAAYTQAATAFGAVLGTLVAAFMGNWVGRRVTYCLLCLGSLVAIPTFFLTCTEFNATFLMMAGLTGAISASFYGWLPLYLPELFPTAVRATGQGFGFNFGRILAAIGVLQLGNLKSLFQANFPGATEAHVYTSLCAIYLLGLVLIWFVPETKGKELPE